MKHIKSFWAGTAFLLAILNLGVVSGLGDDGLDFNGEDEITIQLDPALDPEKNIQVYFRKAKKGEKGLEVIKARRASIREDIDSLEKKLSKIESTERKPSSIASRRAVWKAANESGPCSIPQSSRMLRPPTPGHQPSLTRPRIDNNDSEIHTRQAAVSIWGQLGGRIGAVILASSPRSCASNRSGDTFHVGCVWFGNSGHMR